MDQFGIGAAMRAAAVNYSQSARRSGRTTRLLESLRNGDRVIFHEEREARRVKLLARECGLDIRTMVVPVYDPAQLQGYAGGRTFLDHGWVEEYYAQAIMRAAREIDFFEGREPK